MGFSVEDIIFASIRLNESIVAEEEAPVTIGDYDDDGIDDLMVKFDRSSVQEALEPGDDVLITVTGELTGGENFTGEESIRVIDPRSN